MENSPRCVSQLMVLLLFSKPPTSITTSPTLHFVCVEDWFLRHKREGRLLANICDARIMMAINYLLKRFTVFHPLYSLNLGRRPATLLLLLDSSSQWSPWHWLALSFYDPSDRKKSSSWQHELFQRTTTTPNLWRHKREFNYIIKSASSFQFEWGKDPGGESVHGPGECPQFDDHRPTKPPTGSGQ